MLPEQPALPHTGPWMPSTWCEARNTAKGLGFFFLILSFLCTSQDSPSRCKHQTVHWGARYAIKQDTQQIAALSSHHGASEASPCPPGSWDSTEETCGSRLFTPLLLTSSTLQYWGGHATEMVINTPRLRKDRCLPH